MKQSGLLSLSVMSAWFLLAVLPGRAEISQVSIFVDGLGCPFCVYGLEKKLKKVDGVETLQVDLKSGLVVMTLQEGDSPEPSRFVDAVKKAGFTPGELQITAIGKVLAVNDRLLLQLRNSSNRYNLYENNVSGGDGLTNATRERLRGYADNGTIVAITGTLHQHEDGHPGLSAETLEVVEEAGFKADVSGK